MMGVAVIRIGAGAEWRLGPREMLAYRELVFFLVWRNVKLRYKQAFLGGAWAVLQPLLQMIVFSVFFGRLAGVPSDGVPYPLFAYAGLLPWQLFAQGVSESANSLVTDEKLITKVYFPRLVIPFAAVVSALVDFAVSTVLLVILLGWYRVSPTPAMLLVLPATVMAMAAALGLGSFLAALNVQYRDVRYTLPFMIQVLLFLSPVAYPASLVPESWRWLYGLNPMAGAIEGFRGAVLGKPVSLSLLGTSLLASALLVAGGLGYFRRMERTFADTV